jgi:hypothetical protein
MANLSAMMMKADVVLPLTSSAERPIPAIAPPACTLIVYWARNPSA